ncbi:apolipoprotein N-acyltransferase [Rhizobium sp. SL86]|uniref:apolipoprotein N-acyltransferase n=1 Tax=Rhizobium sp. SL86 TaxID=2995148 RepID=UPI0022765A85|nr:apolipoprotein N-acyltransferase [Rhizobium sp. SL86]MCY1664889.1 apolipoprotein N-acyltransferase [Rhizobium sp. SL86]
MERLANRVMLLWGVRRAALAILAGAFGALALPPFSFVAALFVSFTLLVWLMDGSATEPGAGFLARSRSTFGLGWLFGFGYFVAGLWWLGNALLVEADDFAWALPLAIFGLPAFLALHYGLATWIAGLVWSDGFGRLAALALGFGLAEWLRSFLLTGFPWNAIGYGVMPIPLMMQSDRVIGLFGISALAVFVAAAPALLGTRRGLFGGMTIAVLLALAHLGYGAYSLSNAPPLGQSDEQAVTFRIVQPVIDQARKMDINDRVAVFEEHLALSALPPKPGARRPDIIIWPETSVPFILTQYRDALVRIADVLQDGQILIAGVVRIEDAVPGQPPRYYNSIYAIDSQGQILSAADKVHLTPFGEYLPYETFWNALGISNIVDMPGGFSAGTDHSLLTLPSGQIFYPLICYEAIFPDEITSAVTRASALLNITNDAWFGDTPGPYQHFQQARLRAVETGMSLIRGANSGISAQVDPYGRVVKQITFNRKDVIDSTVGRSSVSKWNNYSRQNNFWLIILSLALIAVISRLGLKFRFN